MMNDTSQDEEIEYTAVQSTKHEKQSSTNKDIIQDKKLKISALDKFKRRLIRAVARLLLEEKKPEEEVWNELKKETSCDCKLLWTRMSALTIKKLKRLFLANDEIDKITKIAQLTVTDWLLFDLVLVHEDVDVIGQEINPECKTNLKILEDLFELVLKYRIEHLSGDILTIAWYDLTAEYNSRGRKCSPMLLQRRWYQMKEQVRNNFYNFWFTYRGNLNKLDKADKYKPTELQIRIVNNYMVIVTEPFKTWDELISQKRVSLFYDFERLQLSKNRTSQAESEPDIEVIEQYVETIDVDSDNDVNPKEDSQDSDVTATETIQSKYCENENTNTKIDSVYDLCDEDEVRALESMHIPLANNEIKGIVKYNEDLNQKINPDATKKETKYETVTKKTQGLKCTIQNNEDILCSGVVENLCSDNEADDIVVIDHKIVESQVSREVDNFVMPKITNIKSTAEIPEIFVDDDDDDLPPEINNVLKNVADNMKKNKSNVNTDSKLDVLDIKDVIKVEDQNIYSDIHFNDLQSMKGIEFVDDGIEFVDEDISEVKDSNIANDNDGELDEEQTPKIDLKLLLDPVVYTKRLDDMDVFRFLDYITIKDPRVIEFSAIESKPFDKKSVNMEDIAEEHQKSKDSESVSEYQDSDNDEEERIDPTSWLFCKPKIPTYDPIKLCKNPDFNTRLKRLTAGFLSLQRNRMLLKECKPLTIDLHKAFELKLDSNMLYLKTSDLSSSPGTETSSQVTSVIKTISPCKLPGLNLTSEKISEITKSSPTSLSIPEIVSLSKEDIVSEVHEVERNKIINLPDIDQIRRTNEKLLIAEVTPIQISSVLHELPVMSVDKIDKNMDTCRVMGTIEKDVVVNQSLITPTVARINNVSSIQKKATNVNSLHSTKLSDYQKRKMEKINIKPTQVRNPITYSWVAKKNSELSEIPTDRFLAPDTVQRIISICKGFKPILVKGKGKGKSKKKKIWKYHNLSNTLFDKSGVNEKAVINKKIVTNEKTATNENTVSNDEVFSNETIAQKQIDVAIDKNKCPKTNKSKVSASAASKKHKYCCWSRQKLLYLEKKIKKFNFSHKCPQYKCACCCRIEYCDKLTEINRDRLVRSEDDNEQYKESQRDKNIIGTEKKVSIGINTDYDKDFEERFAANITLYNTNINGPTDNQFVMHLNRIQKNDLTKKDFDSATQTVHCNNNNPIAEAMPQINVTFHSGPVISDVRSVPALAPIQKITPKGLKCKIVVRSAPSAKELKEKKEVYTKTSSSSTFNTHLDITEEKCANSKSISVNNILIKNNFPKTPICLGKDKILLYSLKKICNESMIDVTNVFSKEQKQSGSPIILPKGVRFALLPNQELVVSIDPGVDLDPTQIAHLPSIIAAVQQQLVSVGVISKDSDPKLETEEVIQLSDDDNEAVETVETNGLQDKNNVKKNDNNVTLSKNTKSDASFVVSENTIEINQELATETNNVISNSLDDNNKNENVVTETQENNVTCAEIDQNNSTCKETVLQPEKLVDRALNSPKEDSINNDIVGLNVEINNSNGSTTDQNDMSKKTILSDLMEMSGISLDDTNVQNIDPPIMPQIQTTTEVSIINNYTPTSQNLSNINPLINNPFVQSALLKCPDLNILSTFNELKDAHKNGGHFYKMCLKTGIIAPITVCIKKTVGPKLIPETKAVIDLTEDDGQIIGNSKSNIHVDNTQASVEGDIKSKPVQPIKLFKALHPSLLKKPKILKRLYPFKRFIVQHKENNTKIVNNTNTVNSDSDDDEPLALKVKRKKVVENSSQAVSKENTHDLVKPKTPDAVSEETTNTDTIEEKDSQEFEEQMSVEPVFFINDDSMEEDCILGV